jgi:hypothetical protein
MILVALPVFHIFATREFRLTIERASSRFGQFDQSCRIGKSVDFSFPKKRRCIPSSGHKLLGYTQIHIPATTAIHSIFRPAIAEIDRVYVLPIGKLRFKSVPGDLPHHIIRIHP